MKMIVLLFALLMGSQAFSDSKPTPITGHIRYFCPGSDDFNPARPGFAITSDGRVWAISVYRHDSRQKGGLVPGSATGIALLSPRVVFHSVGSGFYFSAKIPPYAGWNFPNSLSYHQPDKYGGSSLVGSTISPNGRPLLKVEALRPGENDYHIMLTRLCFDMGR